MSDACVAEGAAWLSAECPKMAQAYEETAPLPLRLKPEGFGQLLSAIISQQVSVASAAAIAARIKEAGFLERSHMARASEDDLRACGLSRQKISYSLALAQADVDWGGLRALETEDVIKELTAIKGIGVWTAEIYAKFSLGRADAFAAGDLALQEGARMLYDLEKRPTDKELRAMAEAWRPWRSVAARILWAYYAQEKRREGIG
ncbi:MAG: DNA-3-methyladenine glycosylase 2 family protein [Rhodobacteraceae bacterium]|nr:DNA-3-methyladenine glycosylase 2 family protein [Paracoccaceae bacterium]